MLNKRLSERPTAVKPERNGFTDPWCLLGELAAEKEISRWLEPAPDVLDHFFRLVGRRRAPNERDALIAKGFDVFQYRLADAIREVDRYVMEHMVENN
jgi:hypothetical protein